ncbi:AMP-binding protein [Mycobacterium colombiense]|uniref:AMP-binding protein n=1 Tax=Mycobacterium colombiense TaxID=339268 RepID=UPI00200A479B|nr:AMP-binding protein [Mycobacterium colombiense]MCK8642337.1 AMP-binding protein [Mycobacterium colombiense]
MSRSALDHDDPSMSFEPLSPLSFLDRAAAVYGGRTAVIDGDRSFSYAELHDRCRRLAGALAYTARGAPVAVLAPNTHMMLEAHFAVPWAGSPLVTINTRLAPAEIRYILEHSGATSILVDPSLLDLAHDAIYPLAVHPVILAAGPGDDGVYERYIEDAAPAALVAPYERALLAINYTSGTTGRPKGVMYHHRGAYLQALAMLAHTQMDTTSAFLWTLPMFHCNGWCFPWAVTAAGATHVCLAKVNPDTVWDLIFAHSVTHMCGAPVVLSTMVNSPKATASRPGGTVQFIIGGSAPSSGLLTAADCADIAVTQAYGLTETHGPALLCDPNPDWQALDADERFRLQARQGVANYVGVAARVIGTDGSDVPADGKSVGEVSLRGNTMMLGYFEDEAGTAAAAPDGWFRTGDLAVMHPDSYIELRDRKKDVIISGGENVTSIEVEQAIESHPAVLEVAVIGAPDERWGEVPVAYVGLRPNAHASEQEIIDHVRGRLARFKVPKRVVFGALPRTSTGKVPKFLLRKHQDLGAMGPTAP